LLATADFVAADEEATFCLSEASLGLIPGVATPFLVRRLGEARFLDLALSGRTVSAREAASIGLVTVCGDSHNYLDQTVERIRRQAPGSLASIKASLRSDQKILDEARRFAGLTAQKRVDPEAFTFSGMNAN